MKLQLFVLCAFVLCSCIAQLCTDVPVAKCKPNPPIYQIALNATGEYTFTTADIDNGSSTTCEPLSLTLRNAPANGLVTCNTVDLIPPYPLTVFLLASSAGSSQPSVCVTRYEVVDLIPPTAVCKENIIVGSNTLITPSIIDGGSFDNCDIKTRTVNVTSVGACDETVYVSLTVTDYSGNVNSCAAVVSVVDSIAPAAKCKNSTQNVGESGSITLLSSDGLLIDNGSVDNCDGTDITLNLVFPGNSATLTRDCSSLGTVIVGLQAIDSHNNIGTCSSNVFFKDLTPPEAICSSPAEAIDVGASKLGATVTGETIAAASSDVCGIASYGDDYIYTCGDLTYVTLSGVTTGADTNKTVSYVITDRSFNEAPCEANITLTDATPPIAKCVEKITVNVGSNAAELTPSNLNAGSYDVCGYIDFDLSESDFTCEDLGNDRSVTLTAYDPFDNSHTCSTPVTFVDNVAPEMHCEEGVKVDVGNTTTGTYTIQPSNYELIDDGSFDTCSAVSLSLNIARDVDVSCRNLGNRTIGLVGKDTSGNTATCNSVVQFVDATNPTIVCQTSVAIDVGNGLEHTISTQSLLAGSSDVCGLVYSPLQSTFSCSSLGPKTIVTTAYDPSGNKGADCTTIVTVVDHVEPVPECKANVRLNVGATGTYNNTASDVDGYSYDACSTVDLEIINTPNFTCSDIGPQDVTLQVTDTSNNVASCVAAVQVVDATAPVAVCGTYIADVGAAPGGFLSLNINQGYLVNAGSTDVCTASADLKFAFESPVTGSCSSLGERAPKLRVTDAYGNVATCVANVTFVDLTPPEVACATLTVLNVGRGSASPILSQIATATDICGTLTYSTPNATTYTCDDIGDHVFEVNVTDSAGNSNSCTTTLRVVDTIPPEAVCTTGYTLSVGEDGYGLLTTDNIDSASSDSCTDSADLAFTLDKVNFTCADVGPRVVTLTVKDESNNTDTCKSSIQVVDITPPNALCQKAVVNVGDTGSVTIPATMGSLIDNNSNDVCSSVSLSLNQTFTGTCAKLGNQTAQLIVKDESGNTDTCTADIEFVDTTVPTIVCRPEVTVNVGSNNVVFDASIASLTAFDVCMYSSTGLNFTANVTDLTCTNIGRQRVNITVEDPSENSASCTTTLIGVDLEGPNTLCQATYLLDVGSGSATLTPSVIDATSVDACGGALSFSLNQTTFTCKNVGQIVPVQLTAVDQYGNPNTCVTPVTLNDTVVPVCIARNHTVYLDKGGLASIVVSDVDNGSYDVCSTFNITLSTSSFTCANVGSNQVTLTVTDAIGNKATCISNVTVIDDILPVALCRNQISSTALVPSVALVNDGSYDNCPMTTTAPSISTTSLPALGGLVTLTVVDNSGNTDTCVSQFTFTSGVLLEVTTGQPLASAAGQLAEHIPFVIGWEASPSPTPPSLPVTVNFGLVNSKNSFYYPIASNIRFSRETYVVSGGISGVTADQDYLLAMYDAATGVLYGSYGFHLIRYPTNH